MAIPRSNKGQTKISPEDIAAAIGKKKSPQDLLQEYTEQQVGRNIESSGITGRKQQTEAKREAEDLLRIIKEQEKALLVRKELGDITIEQYRKELDYVKQIKDQLHETEKTGEINLKKLIKTNREYKEYSERVKQTSKFGDRAPGVIGAVGGAVGGTTGVGTGLQGISGIMGAVGVGGPIGAIVGAVGGLVAGLEDMINQNVQNAREFRKSMSFAGGSMQFLSERHMTGMVEQITAHMQSQIAGWTKEMTLEYARVLGAEMSRGRGPQDIGVNVEAINTADERLEEIDQELASFNQAQEALITERRRAINQGVSLAEMGGEYEVGYRTVGGFKSSVRQAQGGRALTESQKEDIRSIFGIQGGITFGKIAKAAGYDVKGSLAGSDRTLTAEDAEDFINRMKDIGLGEAANAFIGREVETYTGGGEKKVVGGRLEGAEGKAIADWARTQEEWANQVGVTEGGTYVFTKEVLDEYIKVHQDQINALESEQDELNKQNRENRTEMTDSFTSFFEAVKGMSDRFGMSADKLLSTFEIMRQAFGMELLSVGDEMTFFNEQLALLSRTAIDSRKNLDEWLNIILPASAELKKYGFNLTDVNNIMYQYRRELYEGLLSWQEITQSITGAVGGQFEGDKWALLSTYMSQQGMAGQNPFVEKTLQMGGLRGMTLLSAAVESHAKSLTFDDLPSNIQQSFISAFGDQAAIAYKSIGSAGRSAIESIRRGDGGMLGISDYLMRAFVEQNTGIASRFGFGAEGYYKDAQLREIGIRPEDVSIEAMVARDANFSKVLTKSNALAGQSVEYLRTISDEIISLRRSTESWQANTGLTELVTTEGGGND